MESKNNKNCSKFSHKKRFQKPQFDHKNYTKKTFRHVDQVTETEVGISEFLSNLEGFSGVIKARYSDFHVSEVDPSGAVAVLTNTDIPKEEKVIIDYASLEESPIETLPQNIWKDIREMVKTNSKESVKFDVSDLEKEERKNLHTKVKGIFGNKIDSNTIEEDGKKFVIFKKPTQGSKERFVWPEGRGDYVHFILYKEALDTMTACYRVADVTKIRPSFITYAGIKDKRAKTTQWMCVKQVEPWKLIIKTKPIRSIKIGNITFKDTPLKLGDLRGNRFKIALRNVAAENIVIEKAIEHVKDNGFINYYGLQRFGNDKEAPTYTIGVKLLLGNWKEACDLILKQKKSDDPHSDVGKAKKIFAETKDSEKAFNCLNRSKNNCVEAKLLQGLAREKDNYVNALENIPRNMRLLYLHSFQSIVWNKMVSIRIKKYGLKPVENDLVVINDVFVENEIGVDESFVENFIDGKDEQENNPEIHKQKQQVKALTESELSKYTIYDIVLPLPGYDVIYPENLKEEYKEELGKYGLTLEMPKQSVKTYTLSGAYRKILGSVQDLKWKVMKYNDPNNSLILSDFDVLRKIEEPKDIPDGKFKAVILEFTLDASVYATMVLREIMKIDTSPSAQVKLNDYANPSDDSAKIAVTNGSTKEEENVISNGLMHNSILNNKEKMEEFKRSIYGDTTKRRNEEEEDDKKSPKKQKTDD
ncbi:pseudouridylate synthase 7 homolog [Coccinella septempunctata]|uniref:pseudouridylate synthase 7 homolog n=1 Tax=Coccinella septempunctata TaxID=41139 RepID=UPI001D082D66|nr:pseudouridylate synthase 7 homolog [Coccinella septempunctata]